MCRPILPHCKPKINQVMEREEDDKLVLYRGHHLFVMGLHTAEIWRLCDGKHTVDDMTEVVVGKYNAPMEKAVKEITDLLNQLAEKELITLCGAET